MRALPAKWVRRLVVTPLAFLVALVVVVVSPAVHVLVAIVDLSLDRRRWRYSRLAGLGLAFCVVEVFGLFAMFTTWVASGFGLFMFRPAFLRAHLVLMGQWLELITRAIRFWLGFRFEFDEQPHAEGPVLLFSRHAGPGDALLLARMVVRDQGRKLQMIGTTKLQWDPFFDHMGERLGFHYVSPGQGDPVAELATIRRMAADLPDDGTLIIFPEGGNFTPGRKEATIQRMERRSNHAHALRAVHLRHLLAPRAGGVSAALDGAPGANVLFVVHAGLEGLHGIRDLWDEIPLRRRVRATAWLAALGDRPSGYEATTDWLFVWWRSFDMWIESHLLKDVQRHLPG